VKLTEFNPGSRDHVASWLKQLHGWEPKEFTNDGKPKIDDTILNQLKYPEAKVLAEYFMVAKRLGQVAEGDQAWFRHVKADGRIHGSVITNGAVTGRMTHAAPNMAQVPAGYSPYGPECRDLFTVPPGKRLVGADASALELRCLAGYMARWDGGAYIKTVVDGRKEDGTEIHTVNRKALEIDSRDDAKTWFYAFIYGGGDEKLGSILLKTKGAKARRRGKVSRDKFLANLPALGKLVDAVQKKVKTTGALKGLDGRWLYIRSPHSALNTLLQSAGAILMKVALVCLDRKLQELGYEPGTNYEFVANVHDEWQIECDEHIAEQVGMCAVAAMEEAGRQLNFRCPITGEYRAGASWKETH
jgi:DNA polymerase I-like protein with 3'-5' exonuclease and polymerase domains